MYTIHILFRFAVDRYMSIQFISPRFIATSKAKKTKPKCMLWDTLYVNIDISLTAGITILKWFSQLPGPRLNINIVFPKYGDSHVKNKRFGSPYYL